MSKSDSERTPSTADLRQKIIGLGDKSLRKNYYPELKRRIAELEAINEELRAEISEREKAEERTRKLEAQLKQSQKMEAIGTLAGGIAHDFNNILTAVIGYTELARINIPPDVSGRKDLEQILKAGHRARDLVKQILAFSRQNQQEKQPLRISLVIREALKFLRSSIPTSIEITEQFDPDLNDTVLADATQIHQIVMNLGTNAYHALRDNGGVMRFGLTSICLDRGDTELTQLHLATGTYLVLEVSDNGIGMERVVMDRVFDPYFTTKPKGEGTGMGLAVVHGIVKSHGGHISVYSEPGQGTVFRIYLPALANIVPEEGRLGNHAAVQGGSERVLVVDDEVGLVEMTGRLLESLGYQVVTESNPLQALRLFRKQPDDFDLVLTDMTMPVMDGVELVCELFKIRQQVPVIICTGFSERLDEKKARGLGISAYVMKPIIRSEIARVIRKVLDQ